MMGVGSSRRRSLKMGWLILALLVLAGCGQGKPGTVEGKVTVDGTPVTSGIVSFTRADGEARAVFIGRNGTYRALNILPGPVKVAVMPRAHVDSKKRVGADEPEGPPQRPVQIPKKYIHADTSGLSTTVHSGTTNTYDIEMSSR
jgi:hypothetical protein